MANKNDLDNNIKVANSEREEFSNSIGAHFHLISAKNKSEVDYFFQDIGQRYFESK